MLRKQEQGVARQGQHLEVTAIDVRLRDAAIKLQLGGAGFFSGYPTSSMSTAAAFAPGKYRPGYSLKQQFMNHPSHPPRSAGGDQNRIPGSV